MAVMRKVCFLREDRGRYELDSTPGAEQLFAEQLALSLFFCAVNFTAIILLRVFKSSATAQEEPVRKQRRRLSLSASTAS